MERYHAYQIIIRISHADESVVRSVANELAIVTSARWGMDGANIQYGFGLWKERFEHSATIEIVTRETRTNEDMQMLRNHVVATGLTAFVTVNEVTAFELY